MAAVLVANPVKEAARPRVIVKGEVPSALRPPPGCRFHPRCQKVMEVCRAVDPALTELGGGHA